MLTSLISEGVIFSASNFSFFFNEASVCISNMQILRGLKNMAPVRCLRRPSTSFLIWKPPPAFDCRCVCAAPSSYSLSPSPSPLVLILFIFSSSSSPSFFSSSLLTFLLLLSAAIQLLLPQLSVEYLSSTLSWPASHLTCYQKCTSTSRHHQTIRCRNSKPKSMPNK